MTSPLDNHPWPQKLARLSSLIIVETRDQTKRLRHGFQPVRPLYSHEEYTVTVFRSCSHLVTLFKQMEEATYFMSNFRSTKKLKQKGISRLDHIRYHIEGHLFRLTGSFDRTLRLLNVVYQLGLTSVSELKWAKIKNAAAIRGSSTEEVVEKLWQLNRKYSDWRNEIAHEQSYTEEWLHRIELLYVTLPYMEEHEDFPSLVKQETDKYVIAQKRGMLEINQEFLSCTLDLFTALEPEFDIRLINLEKP